jgi:sec-independent protein translocase protein TatA
MFEDPMQWIVIGVVVIALLMWGPNKIPELAASIGKARREFDTAKKEIENPMNALLQSASQIGTPQAPQTPTPQVPQAQGPTAQPQLSGDETLLRTAREMGIATEGKTREQLSLEIVSKATQNVPDPLAKQGT